MKFNDKFKYYAVATESSFYVKKGETQVIPLNELDETLKTRTFKFGYSENMHWDTDTLPCDIVKETTHYDFI